MKSITKGKYAPKLLASNSRNRKSHASTSRTRKTRKPPKSKAFLQDLRGKITNKRGTPTSCVIPKTNPTKEYLQELLTKIPRKSSEKQQKGKTGETTNNLEESCSIFYTCQERFIHGLACLPIIHPSLKISP
jgi:hypothetical protein